MALGASLLEDVAATIAVSAQSDAVPKASMTYGSAKAFSINKATVPRSLNTADHSGGQDLDEWHRVVKRASTVDVEYQWGPQASGAVVVPTLVIGVRVQIVAAVTVGGTLFETTTIEGIITDDSHEYAGPSTGKITIKACGGGPLITAS